MSNFDQILLKRQYLSAPIFSVLLVEGVTGEEYKPPKKKALNRSTNR